MKRLAFLAVAACLWSCVLTDKGRAGSITYTEQGVATGSLGTTPFTNALVTISVTGDTANVFESQMFPTEFTNITGTAKLTIGGIPGTAMLTSGNVSVFVTQEGSPSVAGFGDGDFTILINSNSSFATYGLKTSIGPLSGDAFSGSGVAGGFETDHGKFMIASLAGTATFTATAAVPEPASLTLAGIVAAGLVGYGWRGRRPRRPVGRVPGPGARRQPPAAAEMCR
jgi:hypothetical protein